MPDGEDHRLHPSASLIARRHAGRATKLSWLRRKCSCANDGCAELRETSCRPHPEEPRVFARRLEGWPQAPAALRGSPQERRAPQDDGYLVLYPGEIRHRARRLADFVEQPQPVGAHVLASSSSVDRDLVEERIDLRAQLRHRGHGGGEVFLARQPARHRPSPRRWRWRAPSPRPACRACRSGAPL